MLEHKELYRNNPKGWALLRQSQERQKKQQGYFASTKEQAVPRLPNLKKIPVENIANFTSGWPDQVVDGRAIEQKYGNDKVRPNQRLCHEWLYKVTGHYPLIEYTDPVDGSVFVFKSYHEFDLWKHKKPN